MILDSFHERLAGSVLFPASQYLYNRRKITAEFRGSRDTELLPVEGLASLQMQRLRAVLEKADRFVPFYRKRFKQAGVKVEDFRTFEDLRAIPPLSRNDLIEAKNDLVDCRYRSTLNAFNTDAGKPGEPKLFSRFSQYPLVKNTSSGSTGTPTVFYENGSVSAISWANELRVKRWFGLRPGVREARLVRVSPDFVKNSRSNVIRKLLWNQMILPGVNLTDMHYADIDEALQLFKPTTIWGFTSAAAGLSRWIKEHGQLPFGEGPRLVITWAAPLYEHERELINEAFECPITNIYGMREVGHIGALCPANSMHVFQESHFLETDINGELLVTFLRQTPMPFIRYRTGDIGELAVCKCSCGRTLQIIKEFHGRTGEVFKTEDGRMFSPNFWCRTFMNARLAETVKRFQIVYTQNNTIKIRMILPETNRPNAETLLREIVSKNFGIKTGLQFDYPGEIAPQISGKYQMVINETNSPKISTQ